MSLTPLENALKYLGGIITFPIAPLFTYSVNQNYCYVIQRFGKVDRIMYEGLRWAPPFCDEKILFLGTQTHKFSGLHLIEKNGSPILVSAILNYRISNPIKYIVAADAKTEVVMNMVEGAIRDGCKSVALISDTENDLRKHSDVVSEEIKKKVKEQVLKYGIIIDSIKITEANYAPEIIQQMLMKQQAQAYIQARSQVVEGAVGIIEETIKKLPNLSKEAQEKVVVNLLTTLTSNNSVQPVVQLQ